MGDKLEMSEEQLKAVTKAVRDEYHQAGHQLPDSESFARQMWDAIAPIVLEEAARRCDAVSDRVSFDGWPVDYAAICAEAIRGMKP